MPIDYQEVFNKLTDWHIELMAVLNDMKDNKRVVMDYNTYLSLKETVATLTSDIKIISAKLDKEIREQKKKNKADFEEMVK